ncbi:hypothetical protein L1987_87247 [Smallanthus sonchifolius]|nr:hypothetical protein L1987_87247 [Smallanthus sonchifolius]
MSSSKTKSNGASILLAKKLQQSISPSSANASSMANLSSPNRISLHRGHVSSSPSVRFSIDHRNASPNEKNQSNREKKTCMCSPTTHPGSFRCSLHRNTSNINDNRSKSAASYQAQRLYARRSAMTNSLVRIGTVEDSTKRFVNSVSSKRKVVRKWRKPLRRQSVVAECFW